MNVHEIADKYGLPVKKLAKLEKAGLLVTTPGDSRPAKMKSYLASNRPLSVEQLLDLRREPDLYKQLGKLGTYAAKARNQVAALGDIEANALPADSVANLIYGAAIMERDSLMTLQSWIKDIIPVEGCAYHYVATRIMLNVPGGKWRTTYKYLPRAIINLRNLPGMAGWSGKDGGLTKFFRNDQNLLDL